MIPQNDEGTNSLEFGAFIGLLRTAKCLFKELDDFRKSPPDSIEENSFWQQCERRFQEVEMYRDVLPDDIIDMIVTHVIRSYDCVDKLSNQDVKCL